MTIRTAEQADSGTAVSERLVVHPLGGLESIGTSACLLDDGCTAILIDAGRGFPAAGSLPLPESPLLDEALPRLKAIFCTHGHYDHAAAVPLILEQAPQAEVIATRETLAFLQLRYGLAQGARVRAIGDGDEVCSGAFYARAHSVEHSVPGSLAWEIRCGQYGLLFSGDFSSLPGSTLDRLRSARVDLALCDSTNAHLPAGGLSEAAVREALRDIIRRHQHNRIVMTTFASNIGRIQAAIDVARECSMDIRVEGEAMSNALEIGRRISPGLSWGPFPRAGDAPSGPTLVLASGCQGEETSAFMRLLSGGMRLASADALIISASPVPGNEEDWRSMLRSAAASGATVCVPPLCPVHASGHAVRDTLRQFFEACRPRLVLPVHGDLFQRRALAGLAEECGLATVLPGHDDRMDLFPGLVFMGNSLQSGLGGRGILCGAQERAVMARAGVASIVLGMDTVRRTVRVAVSVRGCIRADLHAAELARFGEACEAEVLDAFGTGILALTAIRKLVQEWAEREFAARFGVRPLILVTILA